MRKKPVRKADVAVVDMMFRGIPVPLYRRLKVMAAKEGIYLKTLIVRLLEEGSNRPQ